jgi:hypothetical protein
MYNILRELDIVIIIALKGKWIILIRKRNTTATTSLGIGMQEFVETSVSHIPPAIHTKYIHERPISPYENATKTVLLLLNEMSNSDYTKFCLNVRTSPHLLIKWG